VLGISLNNENYICLTEDDFLELLHISQEHKTCTKKTSDQNLGDTKPSAEG